MIGRKNEIRSLETAYDSKESEFVAVYGRRRVGKTYLVRETFRDRFVFYHSGLAQATLRRQLARFRQSLLECGAAEVGNLSDWDSAFDALKRLIRASAMNRKVVFIDEMPWLDTPRSGFVSALESFWNGWAAGRGDVVLIVCGSAASWIVKNLFQNKGGLHNRVTCRIHLQPFTLRECADYAASNGVRMSREDIVAGYMALGGIPYYWKYLDRRLSLAQNFDMLFFAQGAPLRYEFDELYTSLFGRSDLYREIVSALASRAGGMDRQELCDRLKTKVSGKLTCALQVLEECGFIRIFNLPGKKKKGAVIQLMDAFTLFHFRFLARGGALDEHTWTLTARSPSVKAWQGLAFERVCLQHLPQIRSALGIAGVHMEAYAWSRRADALCPQGAQVDLVLDRSDNVVNLCEMTFSQGPFLIDKKYAAELQRKLQVYGRTVKASKALHLTLVTPAGVVRNEYANLVQSEVTLEDLFK